VPHKSGGNVYVYDDVVQQSLDYDVPTTRYITQQQAASAATVSFTTAVDCLSSTQDYDIPSGADGVSSSYRCYNGGGDDVECFGDYDLLSPLPAQRPASDVDCSLSSNRSSVTSVMSAGSLSSGCASIRSAHQSASVVSGVAPSAAAVSLPGALPVNGSFPGVVDHQPVPRLFVTSDGSADSGIALQTAADFNASPVQVDNSATSTMTTTNGGVSVTEDSDCFDYDVPVPVESVNNGSGGGQPVDLVDHRPITSSQLHRQSALKHASPVNSSDEFSPRRDDVTNRCSADDVARRRRVDELRDRVTRSVQRFLSWTARATSSNITTDATAARHCYGQAKLAGLAVRTSLKELVAVVDASNPPELFQRHDDALGKLLAEVDRRLDRLIECGSEGRSGLVGGGRRATARQNSACRDRLLALAEVVAGLSGPVKQFSDFVATTSAVILRPMDDDLDAVQPPAPSSPTSSAAKVLPPVPTQRRDSLQRDRPPLSPTGIVGPRARRPPLGKPPPPPVKPKPPKSVSWGRRAPIQPRPPATPAGGGPLSTAVTMMNGPVQNSPSRYEHGPLAAAEVTRRKNDDGGWNEDDCDYVSIVRQVEREMRSTTLLAALGHTDGRRRPLDDDDRELLSFFSAQVRAHAVDVDAASADFLRCCASSSTCVGVDAFVRRSRFVVLAAHRLVYVGDVIARHVTDQSVRERVAAAANALCDRLKAVVMATRDAAVATINNENPAAVSSARQTMVDSVRHATNDCRCLCDVINSVSC